MGFLRRDPTSRGVVQLERQLPPFEDQGSPWTSSHPAQIAEKLLWYPWFLCVKKIELRKWELINRKLNEGVRPLSTARGY